jgi:hypothetical protein
MSRIYTVRRTGAAAEGTLPRLVQAGNQSQVLRHVSQPEYEIAVAGSIEVAQLMGKGVKVEQAVADPPEPKAKA